MQKKLVTWNGLFSLIPFTLSNPKQRARSAHMAFAMGLTEVLLFFFFFFVCVSKEHLTSGFRVFNLTTILSINGKGGKKPLFGIKWSRTTTKNLRAAKKKKKTKEKIKTKRDTYIEKQKFQ